MEENQMRKEEIREVAKKNTEKIQGIKNKMRNTLLYLSEIAEKNQWKFSHKHHRFSTWIPAYQFDLSDCRYPYDQIIFEEDGVTMALIYESALNQNYVRVWIQEDATNRLVQDFLKELSQWRQDLFEKWKENAANVALNYFNLHKQDYIEYPTIYPNIQSKQLCVWTNGADSNFKVCKKMKELLGNITHQMEENLDENAYIPVLWDSNEETEHIISVGHGIQLTLSRPYSIHEDLFYYPAILVTFQMIYSEDESFRLALEVKRLVAEKEEWKAFHTFMDNFTKANWRIENGNPVCDIPIIAKKNASFVLKKAEQYLNNDYRCSLILKEIPLFDNEISPCIRVEMR